MRELIIIKEEIKKAREAVKQHQKKCPYCNPKSPDYPEYEEPNECSIKLFMFEDIDILSSEYDYTFEKMKNILQKFQKWILDGYKDDTTIIELIGTNDVIEDFLNH